MTCDKSFPLNAEIVEMNGRSIWRKMNTNLKDLEKDYDDCPCGQTAATRKFFNLIQDTFCGNRDEEDD